MKNYIPFKYILGMIGLFIVMPLSMIFILLKIIGIYKITIAFSIFFAFIILVGPLVFIKNSDNASLVICGNSITNNINDGTSNFGWAEDIKRIKTINIANKEAVQLHYRNCRSKKSILIDFGGCNVKYISISLFSNNQINKIIKHINEIMVQNKG